jgi:hypothetical protein
VEDDLAAMAGLASASPIANTSGKAVQTGRVSKANDAVSKASELLRFLAINWVAVFVACVTVIATILWMAPGRPVVGGVNLLIGLAIVVAICSCPPPQRNPKPTGKAMKGAVVAGGFFGGISTYGVIRILRRQMSRESRRSIWENEDIPVPDPYGGANMGVGSLMDTLLVLAAILVVLLTLVLLFYWIGSRFGIWRPVGLLYCFVALVVPICYNVFVGEYSETIDQSIEMGRTRKSACLTTRPPGAPTTAHGKRLSSTRAWLFPEVKSNHSPSEKCNSVIAPIRNSGSAKVM